MFSTERFYIGDCGRVLYYENPKTPVVREIQQEKPGTRFYAKSCEVAKTLSRVVFYMISCRKVYWEKMAKDAS